MFKNFGYMGAGEYLLIDSKFQEKIFYTSSDVVGLFEKVATTYQKHNLPVAVNIAALYYSKGYRGFRLNLIKSTILAPYLPCITNILSTKYKYNLKNLCHL